MSYLIQNLKTLSVVPEYCTLESTCVANFSSTVLYKKNTFWGMVYWGCYQVMRLFDWKASFEKKCLNHLVSDSFEKLSNSLNEMERVANECHEILARRLITGQNDLYIEGQHLLQEAIDLTEAGFCKDCNVQRVTDIFNKRLKKDLDPNSFKETVAKTSSYAVWERFNHRAPENAWRTLGKVFSFMELNDEDRDHLKIVEDVFYKCLPRESKSYIASQAISACGKAVNNDPDDYAGWASATGRFWNTVERRSQINVLVSHDLDFKKEAKSFKVGEKVSIGEKSFTLKEQRRVENDNYTSFSLEDTDLEMLVFKESAKDLSLELFNRQVHVPSAYQPNIDYVDPDSKFLIQTKGDHFLEEHDWEIDAERKELSDTNIRLLDSFTSLVQSLTERDKALPVFTSKNFLVSQNGTLMFTGNTIGTYEEGSVSFYKSIQKALGADRGSYSQTKEWGLNQFSWKEPSALTNYFPRIISNIESKLGQRADHLKLSRRKLVLEMKALLDTNKMVQGSNLCRTLSKVVDVCDDIKQKICSVYDVHNEEELSKELLRYSLRRIEDAGFSFALFIDSYSKEIACNVIRNQMYKFKKNELAKLSGIFQEMVESNGKYSKHLQDAFISCVRGNATEFRAIWESVGGVSYDQFTKWVEELRQPLTGILDKFSGDKATSYALISS